MRALAWARTARAAWTATARPRSLHTSRCMAAQMRHVRHVLLGDDQDDLCQQLLSQFSGGALAAMHASHAGRGGDGG